jgi:tRNA threonylcarbamoyladenosine biosynthesis protein TsaB
MLILAFETSTDLASCALWHQGVVSADIRTVECPRTAGADGQHSATLLPVTQQLLADAGVTFQDLDAIAFGAGPGAFTGLRMACAIAQGIAVAHDKPVVQVTTLAAMAWQAGKLVGDSGKSISSLPVTALLDARMGEVYVGNFVFSEDGVTQVGKLFLRTPDELMAQSHIGVVCGNVFTEYPQLATHYSGNGHVLLPALFPRAIEIAELAALAFQRKEFVDPELAAPLYVRDRVAKTIAERLAEGGKA